MRTSCNDLHCCGADHDSRLRFALFFLLACRLLDPTTISSPEDASASGSYSSSSSSAFRLSSCQLSASSASSFFCVMCRRVSASNTRTCDDALRERFDRETTSAIRVWAARGFYFHVNRFSVGLLFAPIRYHECKNVLTGILLAFYHTHLDSTGLTTNN